MLKRIVNSRSWSRFAPYVLALASLAAGSVSGATAQVQGSSIQRFQGEELYYSLELFGSELARAALVMGQAEEREGGRVLPVYGLALTEGLAAMIYPMRDEGSTLIDAVSGLALTTLKELNEQGEYRSYQVDFSQTVYKADVSRVRFDVTSYYERLLPSSTHDAFSWAYAIREQDLTPGTSRVYYVYDGWRLSRVTATVLDEEEDVLVGEEFIRCRRINLYREVMDSARPLPMIQETASLPPALWVRETRSGEQVGDLLLSADSRRLPVQLVFANRLVSVTARLRNFRPPSEGY